jgi:hypothetical protein
MAALLLPLHSLCYTEPMHAKQYSNALLVMHACTPAHTAEHQSTTKLLSSDSTVLVRSSWAVPRDGHSSVLWQYNWLCISHVLFTHNHKC